MLHFFTEPGAHGDILLSANNTNINSTTSALLQIFNILLVFSKQGEPFLPNDLRLVLVDVLLILLLSRVLMLIGILFFPV